MLRLTKATFSRGLLAMGALVLLFFTLWQLPLPELPKTAAYRENDVQAGTLLPPLAPPLQARDLAAQIARRQGWSAPSGGGVAQTEKKTDETKILGIGKIGQIAVVLVMENGRVTPYRAGQTLPDGRTISVIGRTSVRFGVPADGLFDKDLDYASAATQRTDDHGGGGVFELFPVDRTKLKLPPPIDPNGSAKSGQ